MVQLYMVIAIYISYDIIAWDRMTTFMGEDILVDVIFRDNTCTILVKAILHNQESIIFLIIIL